MTSKEHNQTLPMVAKKRTRRGVASAPASLVLRGGRLTKWKGQVGSLSPHIGALSAGVSLSAFAVSIALGGGLLFAPMAAAQTVTLRGPKTTTQTLPSFPFPLVIATDGTFSVVTTSGDALNVSGNYGTSFIDNFNSTISGYVNGISVRNFYYGDLSVTTSGAVSGNATGIFARN